MLLPVLARVCGPLCWRVSPAGCAASRPCARVSGRSCICTVRLDDAHLAAASLLAPRVCLPHVRLDVSKCILIA